jgi:hypothetical protein
MGKHDKFLEIAAVLVKAAQARLCLVLPISDELVITRIASRFDGHWREVSADLLKRFVLAVSEENLAKEIRLRDEDRFYLIFLQIISQLENRENDDRAAYEAQILQLMRVMLKAVREINNMQAPNGGRRRGTDD